ncbi:MAG: hypothetical protein H6572_00935 [Lewinellaceae bacterium]|nr:hypothetical protein [Lewinellaceae bacterium]
MNDKRKLFFGYAINNLKQGNEKNNFYTLIITTFINLNAQESGICGMSTEDQALMAELYGHQKTFKL